jgi:hypothetical protein
LRRNIAVEVDAVDEVVVGAGSAGRVWVPVEDVVVVVVVVEEVGGGVVEVVEDDVAVEVGRVVVPELEVEVGFVVVPLLDVVEVGFVVEVDAVVDEVVVVVVVVDGSGSVASVGGGSVGGVGAAATASAGIPTMKPAAASAGALDSFHVHTTEPSAAIPLHSMGRMMPSSTRVPAGEMMYEYAVPGPVHSSVRSAGACEVMVTLYGVAIGAATVNVQLSSTAGGSSADQAPTTVGASPVVRASQRAGRAGTSMVPPPLAATSTVTLSPPATGSQLTETGSDRWFTTESIPADSEGASAVL